VRAARPLLGRRCAARRAPRGVRLLSASRRPRALPHPQHAADARRSAPLAASFQPVEETFQGCPPQGDGGDAQLNLRKNRIDAGAWQPVSLASLLALP
jgi:hypothetical protein